MLAGVEFFALLWQVQGYPRGYTRGLHQMFLACSKALFYGAFSKLL